MGMMRKVENEIDPMLTWTGGFGCLGGSCVLSHSQSLSLLAPSLILLLKKIRSCACLFTVKYMSLSLSHGFLANQLAVLYTKFLIRSFREQQQP